MQGEKKMKKLTGILTIGLILVLLIACSSDDNNNANNGEEAPVANDNDGNNNDEGNDDSNENNGEDDAAEKDSVKTDADAKEEETDELSEADKQEILDEYPDALRLGDTAEFERSDGLTNDDLEFKINSFEMVDELEGTEPKNDTFLLVNLTIEDLLEIEDFSMQYIRVNVRDSEDDIFRKEDEELFQEFEEEESNVYTGDLVFDVDESN